MFTVSTRMLNPESVVVPTIDYENSTDDMVAFSEDPTPFSNESNSANSVTNDSLTSGYSELSEQAAERQMDFQREQNQKAMDFSAAREDLAYERFLDYAQNAYVLQVDALKRAGLNPALAYNHQPMSMNVPSSANGVTSSGAKALYNATGDEEEIINSKLFSTLLNAAALVGVALIRSRKK